MFAAHSKTAINVINTHCTSTINCTYTGPLRCIRPKIRLATSFDFQTIFDRVYRLFRAVRSEINIEFHKCSRPSHTGQLALRASALKIIELSTVIVWQIWQINQWVGKKPEPSHRWNVLRTFTVETTVMSFVQSPNDLFACHARQSLICPRTVWVTLTLSDD